MTPYDLVAEGGKSMIVLFALSLAALTEVLYSLIVLRRSKLLPDTLVRMVENATDASTAESDLALCEKTGGPFAGILATVFEARHESHEDAERLVEGAGRRAAHTLTRGLLVLEVVANVAPLIGLLGTVIGIYEVFGVISKEGIKQMSFSAGIGKALITTITGLTIAIPAYIANNYFSRRVDDFMIEMERYATRLMTLLHRKDPPA